MMAVFFLASWGSPRAPSTHFTTAGLFGPRAGSGHPQAPSESFRSGSDYSEEQEPGGRSPSSERVDYRQEVAGASCGRGTGWQLLLHGGRRVTADGWWRDFIL